MQRTHLNIVAHTPKSSAEDTEPFIFVIIADPQIGLLGGCDGWDEDIRIVDKGVDAINALQPVPRFCAILGDLAHHHPECEPGVADCASIFEKQKEDFKKCVARIRTDIPVVLVPGNHDVGNAPTLDFVRAYRNSFGPDYYSFDASAQLRVIVLNSSLLYDSSKATSLANEQLAWLDKPGVLDGTGSKIVLMHHPMYLDHEDEEDNLPSQSHFRGVSFSNLYFHIPKEQRRAVMDRFCDAGGVLGIFAGHFHQCRVAQRARGGIAMITTSALGAQLGEVGSDGTLKPPTQRPGFRVVKFMPATENGHFGEISSKYFNTEDVPTHSIPLHRDKPDDW